MESSALTSVIAQKVFFKNTQLPKELQKVKKSPESTDSVNISSDAEKLLKTSEKLTEFEKGRALQVERVKSQIENKTYNLDSKTIENIAEKIANMFL